MAPQRVEIGIVLCPLHLFTAQLGQALLEQIESRVSITQSGVVTGGIILRNEVIGIACRTPKRVPNLSSAKSNVTSGACYSLWRLGSW